MNAWEVIGKMPDKAAAEALGVSVWSVRRLRRESGIAPFRGASKATPPHAMPPWLRRKQVLLDLSEMALEHMDRVGREARCTLSEVAEAAVLKVDATTVANRAADEVHEVLRWQGK